MASNVLEYNEKIEEAQKRLKSPEAILGKGLLTPFVGTNSGARKILASVQRDHIFPLIGGEKAIIETGYEIRFGDYSSSITRAESSYTVVAKISKFSFAPDHHYWLILKDDQTKRLDVVERISYHHVTIEYGYLNNNEYLDTLSVGSKIPAGQIVQKSLAFDEYNNRTDGVNMNTLYLALDDNMEDSILISDVAAGKLTASLIKRVPIMINNNDIPLGIQPSEEGVYKIIPDIGEDIQDAILIGLRKEKKNEALFCQSVENLRKLMMPDEIKQTHGKVLDIDIMCNNPDILDNHYYGQLKMYYLELKRRSREIIQQVLPYVSDGYELSYDLKKLFGIAKREANGDLYIDKRPFSNIELTITVLEELKMNPGDKGSNRYGGKGICSNIIPQKMMPRYKNGNGKYEYADIIFNSSTMYNRENFGQAIETTINHASSQLIDHIISTRMNVEDAFDNIVKFIEICSPQQAEHLKNEVSNMNRDELIFFLENIINDGIIHLSIRPLSDVITIDTIAKIYDTFPFIKQQEVEMPIIGSNNQLRYVPARRKLVMGKQYFLRLKQFSEEKFMATSLSATNIRNENVKSKAKKDYRNLHSNTPVRVGNMEANNFLHAGPDVVISNMMIHSLSPQGRRLVEQMYTGDPYIVDIKLDSDSVNRSAETVNTYLKAIGRRLKFFKKLKKIDKITFSPIEFNKDPYDYPISFVPENQREGFDYEKAFKEREKFLKKQREAESPFLFWGINHNNDRKKD